ncbi:MAG: hypothetical protein DHS20C11_37990 [Lysobacteraceae bacterium]|nr:MAG: hypothetical protein DHS20C11_37990 [Xanthomonadaceae bacterium]
MQASPPGAWDKTQERAEISGDVFERFFTNGEASIRSKAGPSVDAMRFAADHLACIIHEGGHPPPDTSVKT